MKVELEGSTFVIKPETEIEAFGLIKISEIHDEKFGHKMPYYIDLSGFSAVFKDCAEQGVQNV